MANPFSDSFWRCLQDYRLQFPDAGSLGDGMATWLAERARVRRTAFASVLLTNATSEGGSSGGERNFSQEILVDALDCRRHELDDTYELPEHLAQFDDASARRRTRKRGGSVWTFQPA